MDDVAIDVQDGENSHDSHEDTCRSMRQFFFLLIVGAAIKAQITEPRQRSDLPEGGLEVLCVDS